jgi:hypothetical protein
MKIQERPQSPKGPHARSVIPPPRLVLSVCLSTVAVVSCMQFEPSYEGSGFVFMNSHGLDTGPGMMISQTISYT